MIKRYICLIIILLLNYNNAQANENATLDDTLLWVSKTIEQNYGKSPLFNFTKYNVSFDYEECEVTYIEKLESGSDNVILRSQKFDLKNVLGIELIKNKYIHEIISLDIDKTNLIAIEITGNSDFASNKHRDVITTKDGIYLKDLVESKFRKGVTIYINNIEIGNRVVRALKHAVGICKKSRNI